MSKAYVIVSLDGGIPHVEAVLQDEDAATEYFEELLEHHSGPWELSDNNGNCVMYASNDDNDLDIRVYERNLL